MKIKQILDNFTKDSLLSELFELYPDQKPSRTGYDYVIDKLKSKEIIETDLILHIDMLIEDGEDNYEVYALNSQDEKISLSRMDWDTFISMEIDEDIIEYVDKKVIFGHAVYMLTYEGFTDRTDSSGLDLFEAFESALFNPSNWIPLPINMNSDNPLGGLLDELKRMAEEYMDRFNINDLGEITIESDKVIISDATTDHDKIIIDNVKSGKWIVSIVDCLEYVQEGDPKDYIELTLRHEDLKDDDIYELDPSIKIDTLDKKLNVIENKIVAMDFSHYDELEVYSAAENEPKLLEHGAITPCGLDDGPYTIYTHTNEDGKIVAIRVILVEYEEDYPDM